MGLYEKYILPRAIHFVCGMNSVAKQRDKIVPLAAGDILEIGIGTGLNLSHYEPEKVTHLTGIDPSRDTWSAGDVREDQLPFDFDFIPVSAEEMPFDSGRFDTVVMTYSLCTIPDPEKALQEIRRVLKPGGRLLFSEHGKAPDENIARWQDRLDPVWNRFSGGCHLNRNMEKLISSQGFDLAQLDKEYLNGWKVASFNYCGIAVPH